jgi:hypothetical protein
MADSELSYVPTDELLAELDRRHSTLVVIGKPLADQDFTWFINRKGNLDETVGLMERAKHNLLSECHSKEASQAFTEEGEVKDEEEEDEE